MKVRINPETSAVAQDKPAVMESLFRPKTPSFPIVGIGASAGGLEALKQFM